MATRSNNFSIEEIETLLSCLESMRNVLINVAPEYRTVEAQKKAWDEIARCVNSVGTGERNGKAVKNKWVDLKYRTKKKVAMIKTERLGIGSGILPKIVINDMEKRVIRLMGNNNVDGAPPFSPTTVQITAIRSIEDSVEDSVEYSVEDKGESSIPMDDIEPDNTEYQNDTEPDTPSEGDQQLYDSELWMNKDKEDRVNKKLSSRERVRRCRMKLRKKQDEEITHVIKTQKLTYECVRRIEAKAGEEVENGKRIIKNQEKIIERLDSVVSLMSEVNGHMENFNDNLNILIQVMAAKSGVQIVESDEI